MKLPVRVNMRQVAESACRQLGLNNPEPAGSGMEFTVFRSSGADLGEVAVRVPREPEYNTPGELTIPAWRLLEQEFRIYELMQAHALPAPRPVALLPDVNGVPVLVTEFIDHDDRRLSSYDIGGTLGRLHRVDPGDLLPVQNGSADPASAIAHRVHRRWKRIQAFVVDLPPLPAPPALAEMLSILNSGSPSLLHLDVRACNLLGVRGQLRAMVDWSSAMVSHPALELSRLRVFAELPENALDIKDLETGYAHHAALPEPDEATEALLMMDAVTMLGVVFLDYAPEAERAEWVTKCLRHLAALLSPGHSSRGMSPAFPRFIQAAR